MNIAEQAYQNGQAYRKGNRTSLAGEALEARVMQKFTRSGLDFVHWQSYRNNWMSGYQSVEGEQKEHVPDNDALVIAPLWKFYEAAKQALVELEAIPPETPGVDWTYVEQRKQQMRLEIADFERRFPHYRHEDYDK
jgi:hypothetical protein